MCNIWMLFANTSVTNHNGEPKMSFKSTNQNPNRLGGRFHLHKTNATKVCTTLCMPWVASLLIAGLLPAQDAPKPADATAPAAPAPAAPAPAGANLLPDIPPGGILPPPGAVIPGPSTPFGAKDLEKRKAVKYSEPSKQEIASQLESALDEVSDRRISLIEAVRIALLNDPVIQLAEEEVAIARASRLVAAGLFEPRMSAGITYERRQAEMSAAEIKSIKDAFDKNTALIKASREQRIKLDKEIAGLKIGNAPVNATKEEDLQRQLNAAALDILKKMGLSAGVDISALDKLSKQIAKQGIETRKSILKTLASTEANAQKQKDQLPPISVRRTDTTTFDLSIVKEFRNGIVASPYFQYNNNQTNTGRRQGQSRANTSEMGIDVTFPLGRGRGTIAASGQEMAAEIDVEASQLSLQHTVAERVLAVVSSYWNLAAAQEQLSFLVQSEITSAALAGLTEGMIKADEVPAADASQSIARRAQAMASRIQGEIDLQQAQQTLALAMGVTGDDIIYAPLASDELPSVVSESSVKSIRVPDLVQSAFVRRADYRSSRKLIDSGKILAEQARLNIRPRFDLSLSAFYTGRDEDGSRESYYHFATENHSGPGVSIAFRMDWPFFEDAARGNYAIQQAGLESRRLQLQQTNNQITSGITQSYFVVKTTARELQKQKDAVFQFEKALDTQREKFRLGLATMIDAIQTEERLTQARAQLVTTRLLHAQALVNLRFQTGTLMPHEQAARTSVTREQLVTLPVFGPAPVEQGVKPRSYLNDLQNRAFGETDPHRVLQRLDAKGAQAPAKGSAPASGPASGGGKSSGK